MTLVQTAVGATIRTQYHVTMETTSHRPSVLEEESKIIAVKEKIQNGLSWFKAHSPRHGAGQEWGHIRRDKHKQTRHDKQTYN